MTRDTQPISPRPVLPRLIHQAFADIEHDSTDHAATLRQHRDQAEADTSTLTTSDRLSARQSWTTPCVAESSRIWIKRRRCAAPGPALPAPGSGLRPARRVRAVPALAVPADLAG